MEDTAEKWRKASPAKKALIQHKIEQELSNEFLEDSIEKPNKKTWKYLGSVSLGGKADGPNIRDFAHDD
ncbi:MAG TPA: hypothetical protein VKZ54_02250 [Membranihabitans sp.]|nr:hypothetical protein [Membranihabitans sp.]